LLRRLWAPDSRSAPDDRSRELRASGALSLDITFESTHIEPVDEETSRISGNLTMHGITPRGEAEVVVQVTDVDPLGQLALRAGGRRSVQALTST
jgi:polyisoprenoid-binding protein YceI